MRKKHEKSREQVNEELKEERKNEPQKIKSLRMRKKPDTLGDSTKKN
jgi:hypothetical protein